MNEKLQKLLKNSHTPYYHYPVAAIIVMKDDKEYCGVNVETSSPQAGICAERNALYSSISDGYKRGDIKEIHIMSKTEDDCFPCFICRHALSDFCDKETKIISHTYSGKITIHTVAELCPYPFDDNNLKGNIK